ncbi:MAG: NERD domain-containing protein [Gammaproteobacteria bacterium]|nr:NERD domain-containing protein [Gammaproteobacteria bacterium]
MDQIFSSNPFQSAEALAYLIAGIIVVFTAILLWLVFRRGRTISERKIHKSLARLGCGLFQDLTIHDGVDKLLNVDYVVLTENTIILVMVKYSDGFIYGSKGIDEWTQISNGKSFRFNNPLNELMLAINSVKAAIPNVPITGFLLFPGNCSFPKDKPTGTRLMADLPKKGKKQSPSKKLGSAWLQLKMMATDKKDFV